MQLSQQKCVPCKGDEIPLAKAEINIYHQQIPDWEIVTAEAIPRIKRSYKTKNFLEAVDLITQIAKIAEAEQHHPNLHLHNYNQLEVEIYTHKTKGLHINDFILASKIENLVKTAVSQ